MVLTFRIVVLADLHPLSASSYSQHRFASRQIQKTERPSPRSHQKGTLQFCILHGAHLELIADFVLRCYRAFGDFLFGSVVLHFFVFNFLG